ncbi:MAG TPA: UvrD-helicase domain-containing protein, partial [Chloroflexota bacterium]|nr:UvrD-helicase domain-containing protein [Chloroflexota bacterium]
MTIRELVDAEERRRLRDDFEQTFFVEAGAGTGKTTVLVSRVVALIAAGLLRTAGLVAITFTEAAAAELRGRIRSELEAAAAVAPNEEIRQRCEEAAATIDLAAIQTIHAFAVALLRTYPIEAGLPPGFEVWDDVQFSLAFEERFQIWLAEAATAADDAGRERRTALQRALLLGLRFEDARTLARAFQEHTDLLPALTWPSDPPTDTLPKTRAMGEQLLALVGMIRFAKHGEADPLVQEIFRLRSGALRLREASDDVDALLALKDLPEPKTPGNQANWQKDETGVNAARAIKDAIKDVKATRETLLTEHRTAVLGALLGQLRAFSLAFAEERRCQGSAAFHDLLVWARDLLRDHPEVRARARARFERIFVDEFQDTDPLQAEIVWYLTSDEPTPGASWVGAPLETGKLFVVGDPKQSIYRFRAADIRLVGEIFEQAGPREVLTIRQNFRSARVVLDWVNHHFARDIRATPGIQAAYEPLEPSHRGPNEAKVLLLGEAMAGSAAERRAAEARAIAGLIRTAVAEGWPVRGESGERPARYDDVCLLMPTRTGLRVLEDALAEAAIPYRVEAGSLVLNTQEVRDLLAALRAIDDPSDQVALVAALRSPAYACSDADLLRWVEAGGTFDYQRTTELTGPVADAFASLRRFHEQRQERSAAWLIEAFIRERMLTVQTFGYPHPREAWRRLRYVVAQARALSGAGRPGLRALVNWLEDRQREGVRDQESPRPDSDEEAVRLMTVHGAKGLEFPIVILSDLGRKPRNQLGYVLRNRNAGTLDAKIHDLATVGYAAIAELEKAYDQAERVRLLYVAATRARDYLALSLFREIGDTSSDAGRIAANLAEAPDLATRFVAPD